jgi:ring-1,2-phenylacetyl-CoA epoxidase subunit PaaD
MVTDEQAPIATVSALWQALGEVEDPELPISITDMGLVHSVTLAERAVRVELLPTFTGCPALEVIRDRARRRLLALSGVEQVQVVFVFEPAWTIGRMSEAGRAQLKAHGMSVPRERITEPVICPLCGSTNTTLENPFGPTLCRAIYYCRDCRNPIERFKPPADAVLVPEE